jgi:hypothetical protein
MLSFNEQIERQHNGAIHTMIHIMAQRKGQSYYLRQETHTDTGIIVCMP